MSIIRDVFGWIIQRVLNIVGYCLYFFAFGLSLLLFYLSFRFFNTLTYIYFSPIFPRKDDDFTMLLTLIMIISVCTLYYKFIYLPRKKRDEAIHQYITDIHNDLVVCINYLYDNAVICTNGKSVEEHFAEYYKVLDDERRALNFALNLDASHLSDFFKNLNTDTNKLKH